MRDSQLRLVLAGLAAASTACSAPGTDNVSAEAVREVVQSLERAVNARDWEAFFANFDDGGDLVVFDSPRAQGRAASRTLMEDGWSEIPDDVRADLTAASVRFVTPEVAIAEIDGQFTGSQPSHDRATAVLARRDGVWLIHAFRILQPAARSNADGPPDAVTADADHYSVEFENSLVRVLRVAYPPGARSTLHSHPASCAIFVTDGTFEFTMPDGTNTGGTLTEAGSVSCVDRDVHIPENVGDVPARLVLVELKGRDMFAP